MTQLENFRAIQTFFLFAINYSRYSLLCPPPFLKISLTCGLKSKNLLPQLGYHYWLTAITIKLV